MILSSSRLEATNTLIQTKTEIGIREARGLTEKDRWTIKRDFALEINEMRPRSFITQKFFEEKTFCFCFPAYYCYHLNCFDLLT